MTASENIAPSAVDSTESLYQLIELLFPDPIPDILTLGDFETRYKLTKLGELATQAIEKSQRINHRRGNYQQIGLCEFHVGLIYFASNKYRAARQQFTLARQQWSFVDEPAADALSYFAEGVSHHFALQYELAMSKYSQARQRLSRMKFAPPSDVQNDFVQHLSSLLDIYQGHLQGKLWSHEETSETVHTSTTNTPPHAGNDAPSQAGSPVPAQDTKPAPDDGDAERAAAPNNDAELDDNHETI
ncbi:MAG: hypothetical protein GY943_14090, partial [Chloroflexi bacterium]|nr:hypothetical protein [Chloroflexota bacterium]